MSKEVNELSIPSNTIHYVCGFLFDNKLREVILIWKNKPAWQKGKLNGVGGKVELNENVYAAMRREFKEETGVDQRDWTYLVSLAGEGWQCSFFYAVDLDNNFEYARTMEDEEVAKILFDRLDDFDYIPNLQWLIPMAVYHYENLSDQIFINRPTEELQNT